MKAYFNNSVISFLPLNEAEKPDLDRVLSKQDVYDIITEFITGETPSDLC